MKIINYDDEDDFSSNFKRRVSFMPDRCFRMLICGPSGCGKTNTLVFMINNLLYFDKIYLYAKNLQQDKYQRLLKEFKPFSKDVGYPIIETSNNEIVPLSDLPDDNQKLVIFDDYLNTGTKNDAKIRNYFTNSRNKNCNCIYLSQSFYNTDKTIRLNCSHYCIFDFPSQKGNKIWFVANLASDKSVYLKAVHEPWDSFLYLDKPRKTHIQKF